MILGLIGPIRPQRHLILPSVTGSDEFLAKEHQGHIDQRKGRTRLIGYEKRPDGAVDKQVASARARMFVICFPTYQWSKDLKEPLGSSFKARRSSTDGLSAGAYLKECRVFIALHLTSRDLNSL